MAQRVFVSFDYDNDNDLKNLLIGQARNPDSPFEVEDWSIKVASSGWRADARNRISRSDQVVVLCGQHTNTASGVNVELDLARELAVPYFLLTGRAGATKPTSALTSDSLYNWTWPNLKLLIAGNR
ncbi:TIR domain-containing protein [Frigoribacterium sp. 2-23]|uniref:TIR domain-containing protein n=1 Tax=Frigoribacterium sp. 2-23 TaxID=3415006 RepID=UPI003C6EA87A